MTPPAARPQVFSVFGGDLIQVEAHPGYTPPGLEIRGVDGEWAAKDATALVTAILDAQAYAVARDALSVGGLAHKSVDVLLADVLAVLDEEDAPTLNELNEPYAPVGRLRALVSRLKIDANLQREKAAR